MVRKLVLLVVALLTALAAIPVAAATRPADLDKVASIQEDSTEESDETMTDEEADSIAPSSGQLALGARFDGDAFAFEVQAVDLSTSLHRQGYQEVRVAVAFRNDGDAPIPYSATAFAGEYSYPSLELVDSAGEIYPLDRSNSNMAVAGSYLTSVPVGLPAHWTVGYQVPQMQSDDLAVRLMVDGNPVATWDLESTPVDLTGWEAPAGATTQSAGDSIAWDDDLTISFHTTYAKACGDAYSVVSAANASVFGTITSSATVDAYFPAVQYPSVPFFAIWEDGSTSKYETVFNGDFWFVEVADVVSGDDVFVGLENPQVVWDVTNNDFQTAERMIITPATSNNFGLDFTVPRDSRVVDPEAAPVAMYLLTQNGEALWLDLADTQEFDLDLFGRALYHDEFDDFTKAQREGLQEVFDATACGTATPSRYLNTMFGTSVYFPVRGISGVVVTEGF